MTDPTEPTPEPEPVVQLQHVRDAAQHLADTVRALPPLALPRLVMPRLLAPTFEGESAPDPRRQRVQVRVIAQRGTELHAYTDESELTWQTYGPEHDFSTERLLEIVDVDGAAVATYPPGSWMHVCYPDYLVHLGDQS